jgi:hypothetical protein
MTEPSTPLDASAAPAAEQRYRVYDGTTLILDLSSTPGPLRSTARSPGPPARHPFLSGVARSAPHEDQLRKLLVAATSFDEFVASLTAAGFRLEPVAP